MARAKDTEDSTRTGGHASIGRSEGAGSAKAAVDWLRAVLTYDDGASPIRFSLGFSGRSNVVLIGPDGRILATDLHEGAIDAAVARFLAP